MRFFGQTGGVGPFFKHNHSCTTYKGVDYKKIAADDAAQANKAYQGAVSLLMQAQAKLAQPGAEALKANLELNNAQNKLESLKQQILTEEPQASYNCPDPGWYVGFATQFKAIGAAIQKLSADIDNDLALLQQREQQIAQDASPSVSPANEEMSSRLLMLKQQLEASRKEKMAKLEAIRSLHAKQAAYGRDTQQVRPKAAGYATEAEKLIGGRTGYGNWSKPRSFVCLFAVVGLVLFLYFSRVTIN